MTTRAISLLLALTSGLAAVNSFAAVNPAEATLQFLEQRVKADPMDSVAQNRLSYACILAMRQTGDLDYLERATHAAQTSLEAVPPAQNPGGLTALALAEFESHHFREALDLARRTRTIDPVNSGALAIMGDAELELGNYSEAAGLYTQLAAGELVPSVQARLARLAEIKGDDQKAITLLQSAAAGENAEWYHIRVGEILFRTGQFDLARQEYESAQKLAPNHFLVQEHFAELRAAEGQYSEAIHLYEEVISRVPRPDYFQALGDLYLYLGKPAEAKPWHDKALAGYLKSIEQGNAHYLHHLAGFYSDSVENPAEAVRWACKDLEIRHSVYTHDTLAWALYKKGHFEKALDEISQALSPGTQDAHLLYHASMIFSRAGQLQRGDELLKKTMTVNPHYNSFHVHR